MEGALKSGMYAVFYLTCGVIAALAQGVFAYGIDMPCIGASGAIAGLMGGFFHAFRCQSETQDGDVFRRYSIQL